LELLARHDQAVSNSLRLVDEARTRIRHRREFAGWSAPRLWRQVQDYARRSDDSDIDRDYADVLVEALAPHDVPDAETICRLLLDADVNDGDGWREVFVIDLAGRRQVREAIPLLVGKFRIDSDWVLEGAATALRRMGDVQAVEAIRATFLKETWDFKNFATGTLGAIKCPESEAAILSLLESETNLEIRTMLCHELCQLFSERGIEVVRRQIQAGYKEWLVTLEESLLPVIDVLGIDLPEANQWRKERAEREAALAERRRELETLDWSPEEDDSISPALSPADRSWRDDAAMVPYRRFEERVGRNEPCPCGSGKKHKKCCGKV